jgi:tRNA (guanine-N7-)-methyltransferase
MAFRRWKNPYIDLVSRYPEYILDPDLPNWEEDQRPLLKKRLSQYQRRYVEFGSGSGGHLIGQAMQDSNSLFIGMEIRFKRTVRTAQKAQEQGVQNLLLLRTPVSRVTEFFGERSVDGFYVLFPDPWDKKRWHKHRMLSTESLTTIYRLLKPGGFLSYKTDHSGYFRDTLAALKDFPGFEVQKLTEDLASSGHLDSHVTSEFESLFNSKQIPVNFVEVVKIARS